MSVKVELCGCVLEPESGEILGVCDEHDEIKQAREDFAETIRSLRVLESGLAYDLWYGRR